MEMKTVSPSMHAYAEALFTQYKFSDVLLNVMLSFMLFAGAMEMDLRTLGQEKWTVFILAIVGTLMSSFAVGGRGFTDWSDAFASSVSGVHRADFDLERVARRNFGGAVALLWESCSVTKWTPELLE